MIPFQVSDQRVPRLSLKARCPVTDSVHSPRYEALTKALTAARREAGLTQAEAGEALGRPQSYISKVEAGERRLDVVELLDLLEVLGTDPAVVIEQVQRVGRRKRSARRRKKSS